MKLKDAKPGQVLIFASNYSSSNSLIFMRLQDGKVVSLRPPFHTMQATPLVAEYTVIDEIRSTK